MMPFRSHVKANLLINSKAFGLGNTRNLKLDTATDTAESLATEKQDRSQHATNQPTNQLLVTTDKQANKSRLIL